MKIYLIFLIVLFSFKLQALEIFSLKNQVTELNTIDTSKTSIQKNSYTISINKNLSLSNDLDEISFFLPEGYSVKAKKYKFKVTPLGSKIWSGHILTDPNSTVVFVLRNKKLNGEIFVGGISYTVRFDNKMDETLIYSILPQEQSLANDEVISLAQKNDVQVQYATSEDKFIDLLVAFSAETADENDIQAVADTWVTSINLALEEACVNFRYRLVGAVDTGVTTATEDGNTVLSDFRNPNGTYSSVHAERDQLGADLVHLIVGRDDLDVCGIANRPSETFNGSFAAGTGFGLTKFRCGSGVMIHELGHNMGLRHDRHTDNLALDDSSVGSSFGFVDTINQYRSLMTYSGHCNANQLSCTRLNKFSSPKIFHNGVPFGQEGLTDNYGTVNRTYPIIAAYRQSITPHDPEINNFCSEDDINKDLHCFIATATFGSTLHPKITILRSFRDNVLKKIIFGKYIIKTYYKYSPTLAKKIENNSPAKNLLKIIIGGIIFVIQYYWALLIIFLLFFVAKKRAFTLFAIICVAFIDISKASVSTNSTDQSQTTINPAVSHQNLKAHHVGLYLAHNTSNGDPNEATSIKESETPIGVYGGFRGNKFSFDIRYSPEIEKNVTLTSNPISPATSTTTKDRIILDASFHRIPLGFRIQQSTLQTFAGDNLLASERFNQSLNIGYKLRINNFSLGGGGILTTSNQTESNTSSGDVSANSISAYGGISTKLSFGRGKNILAEINYKRDPEIIAAESSNQIISPEQNQIELILQHQRGPNNYHFMYQKITQNPVNNFFTEGNDFNKYLIGWGLDRKKWSVNARAHLQSESNGYRRQEVGLNLSYTHLLSIRKQAKTSRKSRIRSKKRIKRKRRKKSKSWF